MMPDRHSSCMTIFTWMVTGDKYPRGSYILEDIWSINRFGTSCISVLEGNCFGGKLMVSVDVFHNSPNRFTVASQSAVLSVLAIACRLGCLKPTTLS